MKSRKPEDSIAPEDGIQFGLNALDVGIELFAAGFRKLACNPASVGSKSVGVIDIIAVAFVMPAFVLWAGPPQSREGDFTFRAFYQFMLAMLLVHFVVSKASSRPIHSLNIGEYWIGEGAALLGATLIGVCSLPYCPGIGAWVGVGFFCNILRVQIIRARFRRMAELARDQQFEGDEFQHAYRRR